MACGCAKCRGPGAGFTQVTGQTIACSLAHQLIPVVDRLRDLYTEFGLRPYRVQIIKTRWSQGVRGKSIEEITFIRTLVPTPKLLDMSSLTEIVQPIGLDEVGTVRLEEVSGSLTEDQLRGFDELGTPPGPDEQVFYEVEFFGNAGNARRRFFLRSAPMYRADAFQWAMSLEKSQEDRARNGELR